MVRYEAVAICLAIALTYNFVNCSDDLLQTDDKFPVISSEYRTNDPQSNLSSTGQLSDCPPQLVRKNFEWGNDTMQVIVY